ncbi:MAG: tetratricopeptide repeat protein [Acidobacteria bacterium]|nr:MAG: tetratricopeptide repeat protein [Acidobacteriota bacterium]
MVNFGTLGLLLLLLPAAVESQRTNTGVTALDDDVALAQANLGEAELRRGEEGGQDAPKHFEAAERALNEALSLVPASPRAIHALSSVYMRTGRTEAAAELLRKGVVANPSSARLHAKLGYVFRYAGMMDPSITEYRTSQRLDARFENRIAAERQIIKALIYSGHYDEAFESYASILEWLKELGRAPDEKVQFYQGLGRLYAGNIDHAVRLFDASIATVPDSLWSSFAKAYKYGALGETQKLRDLADELARGNVSDGERRYRLAHLNAMAGRFSKALGHLEASAQSGFFNYPYTKRDRLLEDIEPSSDFDRVLRFIENRHRRFVEQNE